MTKIDSKLFLLISQEIMRIIMMVWLVITVVSCGEAQEAKKEQEDQQAQSLQYGKNDLKKIKWIEGKWKGLYNGKPFYEFYRLVTTARWRSRLLNGTEKTAVRQV